MRYRAGLAAALLAYGLGGAYLLQGLPVFSLFRQPARALILLNLPVALLAGSSSEVLFSAWMGIAARERARRLMRSLSMATLILAGGFALRLWLQHTTPRGHIYWLSLVLTVPAAFALLKLKSDRALRLAGAAWGLLLVVDLIALVIPLSATRPESEIFEPSLLVQSLQAPGRVLDHVGPTSNSPLGTSAPLARLYGIESLRGFDPLDNLRYKEYLQFISGNDEPLRPFESPLAFPIMGDVAIRNKPLLDLLGVRYLLQPADSPKPDSDWSPIAREEHPAAFDCCSLEGGRQALPPYIAYENCRVFPRSFIVYAARPLPERSAALSALTTTDLRHEVLLEGEPAVTESSTGTQIRSAVITDYRANCVTVEVEEGPPGWLVLGDIWYPGWRCTIDGNAVPLRRADYLFRSVRVSNSPHTVVFRFSPDSYRLGRRISLATVAVCSVVLIAAVVARRRKSAATSGVTP
jgi:hypothetical protein